MTREVLRISGLTKRYPGTTALDDVGFAVGPGVFHALLGGNGSGKSTLIKVLAGVVSGDAGTLVSADGASVAAEDCAPAWSRMAGIRFVHQDLGVFDDLTVAENVALGAGFVGSHGRINWADERRRAAELLKAVGLNVAPDARLGALSPAQRTLVAIARALDSRHGEVTLLVLDEPTSRLPAEEVDHLLNMLQELTASGTSVFYVTHRLGEVLRAANTATILRDGEHIVTGPVAGLSEDDLIELIVGKAIARMSSSERHNDPKVMTTEPVLRARDVVGGAVRGVDLNVQAGEILGIGGTVGSGRSSLLRIVFGDVPRSSGEVRFAGEDFQPRSPADAMRRGVAFVPEDRASDGAFMSLSVTENLSAATLERYVHGGVLRRSAERSDARSDLQKLRLRAANPAVPLHALSGGNQQKVVITRWLRMDTKLLLLDEPTQGVDVQARAEIHNFVRQAADRGVAIIVVSSDFEELAALCDRILVLADGRFVAEGYPPEATADWIAEQTHVATVGSAA